MGSPAPRLRLRIPAQGAEPELQCPKCYDWLPIDGEFWIVNRWNECRACGRERNRVRYAMKLHDEHFRESERQRVRRYRIWIRNRMPELIEPYDRLVRSRYAERGRARREAARRAA